MFGPDSNADRMARLQATDSLLDYVSSQQNLSGKLGAADRSLVNDTWSRSARWRARLKLMAKADSLGQLPDTPRGTPDDFTELVDVQFEMIALAYQTGQTRVASLRMIKEASMRTFPNVQVDEAFHPLSHSRRDPASRKLRRVQTYQMERFAKFAKKLEASEGDHNLLDTTMILCGRTSAIRTCTTAPSFRR
jgi:hypothetical protein